MPAPDPIEMIVSHPSRRVSFADVRRLLTNVVAGEHVKVDALSIVFADRATVTALNEQHLGRSYPTDVIAFDLRQSPRHGAVDGEIYIDLDTAAERAPEFGTRFTNEVLRYTVHGLLHLIGYRDGTESEKRRMRQQEDRYLGEFERRP